MQKLKLNVEELSVESLEMSDATELRGTIHGNEFTASWGCTNDFICIIWPTND